MTELLFNAWLKSHWQVLSLLVILVGWGVRLEGKADSHLTKTAALKDKMEILLALETRLDLMHADISTIKEDVSYLRGSLDTHVELEIQ